jgi:site-specific recombinase XerD
VQAQTYQPQLQTPVDISYQDQINEITAQTRQAEKLAGNNPEALAAIYAQATMAKNRVLGEQMRVNQGTKAQTYAGNIDTLNNAQLMNLKAYDAQQLKQETAKSLTKATTQEALNSIASKYAQNKAANRQLAIMENLYNYRYDKSGRAINMNPLAQFDLDIQSMTPKELEAMATIKEAQEKKAKSAKNVKSRNGSIVKAIKNL